MRIIKLPDSAEHIANICGPIDENLRQIEQAYHVTIQRGSHQLTVDGLAKDNALQALEYMVAQAEKAPLTIEDVQLILVDFGAHQRQAPKEINMELPDEPLLAHETPIVLKTRKQGLKGRTQRQREYIRHILAHDITFGLGPAGTGKTFLAVACAVDALERDLIKRIVLTRPAVEAGERLGFLPGDLAQKVDPYLRPLYDALYDLMGFEKVQRLFEKQMIEIAPLAYMRGRTLNQAFIILDEAQNTTPEQMKMFLTRIGFGSKAVITGDPSQIDLPKAQKSGLVEAHKILPGVKGIAFTQFTSIDVVRHPLVARIVDAYEAYHAHPSQHT